MHEAITGLMRIGTFARRSRLSLKALRLYDDMGLLPPAYVDPESGYRYYSEGQLKIARLIVLLRRIDMPLGSILEVIAAPEAEAAEKIDSYWSEVEETVQAKRRVVSYLRNYLFGKDDTMSHQVKTRTVAAQTVLSSSKEVYTKDLPAFIQAAIGEMVEHISAQGAEVAGAPEAIFHGQVDEDNNGPVEVTVPFVGAVTPTGHLTLKEQPERQEAYATITLKQLEFPAILNIYDTVHAWLEKNGKTPAGSPREVYFSDTMNPEANAPFCDIAWPFTSKERD